MAPVIAIPYLSAVPLIVLSGISLDRVRSTATADLGFAAELLYAVPLKVDDAKIANADSRIRGVRDDLARANGVAGASLADGLPLAFRGDTCVPRFSPTRTRRRSSSRFTSPVWITTI